MKGVRGHKDDRELQIRFGDAPSAPLEWLPYSSPRLRSLTGTAVNSASYNRP